MTWSSSGVNGIWSQDEVIAYLGRGTDSVQDVAVSPSGRQVLAFQLDGSAQLWDIADAFAFAQPQQIQTTSVKLQGHSGVIRSAVWNPSGAYIATTSIDGTARVWDAFSGKNLTTLRGHTNLDSQAATAEVIGAFWVGDRFLTTYGEDGSFRLWEVFDAFGQPIDCPDAASNGAASCLNYTQLFKAHSRDITLARWRDADTILTTDRVGNAGRFDLKTGRTETRDSDDWEYPVTIWNPAGDQLLTYEELDDEPEATKSEIRDFASGETIHTFDFAIAEAVWLDDALILGGETAGVTLYDPTTFEPRAELTGSVGALTTAALSPDNLLAAAFLDPEEDVSSVYVWDLAAGAAAEPVAHYAPQSALEEWPVARLDWETDDQGGDRLLMIGTKAVVLWDVVADEVLLRDGSDNFTDAALSADGRWLAVAEGRNVRVLNVADGSLALTLPQHANTVQGVAWTWGAEWPHQADAPAADERLLLLTWSGDGTARVWDWPRRQQIDLLYGDGPLNMAAFSPNRERILTAASNGALRVWDAWVQQPAALYAAACGLVTRPLSAAQVAQFALAAPPPLGCIAAAAE
ncbi:MAG: hypothetical protein R2911_10570 [Caldilineaceae bacterium]